MARLWCEVDTPSLCAPSTVPSLLLGSRSPSLGPGGHLHLESSPPMQNLETRVSYCSVHPPHLVSTSHPRSFLCFRLDQWHRWPSCHLVSLLSFLCHLCAHCSEWQGCIRVQVQTTPPPLPSAPIARPGLPSLQPLFSLGSVLLK